MVVAGLTFYALMFLEIKEFTAKEFKAKFGALFENLNPLRWDSISFPLVFFMRRILVVMLFNIDIMILRVALVSFGVQTAYIIYWTHCKPLTNGKDHLIELVNEIAFTVMMDLQPVFTDLVPDLKVRYNYGWIFIFCYIGLFIFNLAVIIIPIVGGCKRSCIKKLKVSPRFIKAKAKATDCCSKKKKKKEKKVKIWKAEVVEGPFESNCFTLPHKMPGYRKPMTAADVESASEYCSEYDSESVIDSIRQEHSVVHEEYKVEEPVVRMTIAERIRNEMMVQYPFMYNIDLKKEEKEEEVKVELPTEIPGIPLEEDPDRQIAVARIKAELGEDFFEKHNIPLTRTKIEEP